MLTLALVELAFFKVQFYWCCLFALLGMLFILSGSQEIKSLIGTLWEVSFPILGLTNLFWIIYHLFFRKSRVDKDGAKALPPDRTPQ